MSLATQQPVVPSPVSTDGLDWMEVEDGVFQRSMFGGEASASFNQNVADGHTEICAWVRAQTTLPNTKLVQRIRNAWLHTRITNPEISIEMTTDAVVPQLFTYRIPRSQAEIDEWMNETLVIQKDRNIDDVLDELVNRKMTTRGKRSIMVVVLQGDAASGKPVEHDYIWNVSHAAGDVFSFLTYMNKFFDAIVRVPEDFELDILSMWPDKATTLRRLPCAMLPSYLAKYNPSPAEVEGAVEASKAQLALLSDKMPHSVALYPEADFAQRQHRTHNIRIKIPVEESAELFRAFKAQKLSITYAAAAATILSVFQIYAKGHETGALLGMTRNARRWVKTDQDDPEGRFIPCAADVVFLWIPFPENLGKLTRNQQIRKLAPVIRDQLGQHLLGPHYIAAMSFMSNAAIDGLRVGHEHLLHNGPQSEVVSPSAPGFSSQGKSPVKKTFEHNGVKLTRTDYIATGRQINASPWIGMWSIDGEISVILGWDARYYRMEKMEKMIENVVENIKAFKHAPEPSSL